MVGTTTKTTGRCARRCAWAAALLVPGLAVAEAVPGMPAGLPPPPPVEFGLPPPPPPDALPAPPAATPPAAAPAPATVPAPAATPAAGVPDPAFDLRVKALEEKVYGLKEQVFRSKARLMLLDEKVAGGDLRHGTRGVIVHRNEMDSFYLESLTYLLDGEPIFTRTDVRGDLANLEDIEVFRGRLVPGTHTVAVQANYRGRGWGPFSYLEGYKFKVRTAYELACEGGKTTTLKVVAHEKGWFATPLADRPATRFEVEVGEELPPGKAEASK